MPCICSVVPVYFAGQINYASAASQGPDWANFAIVATVITAALFEAAILLFRRRMFVFGIAMLILVIPFFAMNMLAASGNVASADKHVSEVRKDQEKASNNNSDRRADAVKRREKAEKEADGETEESALAKVEQSKAEHPSIWKHSQGCDPKFIKLPAVQLCKEVAALKAKAAAAKAYANAVTEIAGIDAQPSQAAATMQSTGEGAAANLVAVVAWFGHNTNQEQAEKAFEWGRGGMLELGGAIGPGVMNLLAWLLLGGASEAEARRIAAKERRRIEAAEAKAQKEAEKARKAREAEEAEERRREAEARLAAELEARAAAEAEEKAKADRAAKRATAKTREKGDPETVKTWANSKNVIHAPGQVLSLSAAYLNYEADCLAHGEMPVARGRWFAEELRKLGIDVRERGNQKRFEIHGLALSHAERPSLRVVSSR